MKKVISNETVLFDIIKSILTYTESGDVQAGVESADDCALIRISDQDSIAITSDFVRGSGFTLFRLGYLNYYDVGYYLIAANLSDLAAVGAKPIGLTTIVRYGNMDDEDFRQVFQGMKAAADASNAKIIGGDIGSYTNDVFAATAFGWVKTNKALLRKNARDGDLLCITGTIGKPISAILYFKELKPAGFVLETWQENLLLDSWKRPKARIEEGLILSGFANACQDVSDGLKATIDQLSKTSGKTFTIYEDKLPITGPTRAIALHWNIEPAHIALSASVDFELLFTISPEKLESCQETFNQREMSMTVIGEVNNIGKNQMLNTAGQLQKIPGVAWDHRPIQEIIEEIKKDKST